MSMANQTSFIRNFLKLFMPIATCRKPAVIVLHCGAVPLNAKEGEVGVADPQSRIRCSHLFHPTYIPSPCSLTFKDVCRSHQDVSQLPSQSDTVCCLPFLCAEVKNALNREEQSRRTKSSFSAEKK